MPFMTVEIKGVRLELTKEQYALIMAERIKRGDIEVLAFTDRSPNVAQFYTRRKIAFFLKVPISVGLANSFMDEDLEDIFNGNPHNHPVTFNEDSV